MARHNIRSWFQKKIFTRNRNETASDDNPDSPANAAISKAIPHLPVERPRPLTPSHESRLLPITPTNATAKSDFFQCLPAEIRRQILIEAFGDRIMHMDLSYNHPVSQRSRIAKSKVNHRGLMFENEEIYPSPIKYNTSKPKRWQWNLSSVCHRDSEVSLVLRFQSGGSK